MILLCCVFVKLIYWFVFHKKEYHHGITWLLVCVERAAAGGLVVLHSVLQFMTHVQVTECSGSEGRNLQSILNACQAASQCCSSPCIGKRRQDPRGLQVKHTRDCVFLLLNDAINTYFYWFNFISSNIFSF